MRGPLVAVEHAVIYEGDQPHKYVDEGVDEHEAKLAVDSGSLLDEVALHGRSYTFACGRWTGGVRSR